jgi:hypothetical protein
MSLRIALPNDATLRRQRAIDFLDDTLTSPNCPLDADDLGHFRLVGGWYGSTEMLKPLAAANDEWPEVAQEAFARGDR